MDGIINVRKESGYTSQDVVSILRGILHTKKVGHTGTLDPAAEGVLPVCVGKATVLVDLMTEKTKTYEAVLLLGTSTDTQDSTGEVLSTSSDIPDEETIRRAMHEMEGDQLQTPPMYSAKKINGKKLYELAREGKTVERKAVPVTISDLEILEMNLPRVRFRVTVSKGTYIRTLCHDIGEKLGCGGCMDALLRTCSGKFVLEDSYKLSEIESAMKEGRIEDLIIPLESWYADLPAVTVSETGFKRLMNGNPLPKDGINLESLENTEDDTDNKIRISDGVLLIRFRIHTADGGFIGVYEWDPAKNWYYPEKLFLRK